MNEKNEDEFVEVNIPNIPLLLASLYLIFVFISLFTAGVESGYQFNDTSVWGAGPTIHFGAFLFSNSGSYGFTRMPVVAPPFLKRYTFDIGGMSELGIETILTAVVILYFSKFVLYLGLYIFALSKSKKNRNEREASK